MVVPCAAPAVCRESATAATSTLGGIPTIDMMSGGLPGLVLRACSEFGFFKVVNHGVPDVVTARLEAAGAAFFALPVQEKHKAGPPTPLGYGCRNIGFNGDVGELEYLLLHTNPASVSHKARTIDRNDPSLFSDVVNEYVGAVRQLACEILELVGEGLGLKDTKSLSKLIRDTDSDSLLRINHYPPCCTTQKLDHHDGQCMIKNRANHKITGGSGGGRVGFGEHSDPQILSILRSNDVDGLQVLLPDGTDGTAGEVWVQVPADPAAFFVHVGDLLQAMTNGKMISIRHRAMASSGKPRLSTIYFAAPPLHAQISALPGTVTADTPRRYRPFTWAEYKKTMYSLRLSHSRLDLFRADDGDGDNAGQEEE